MALSVKAMAVGVVGLLAAADEVGLRAAALEVGLLAEADEVGLLAAADEVGLLVDQYAGINTKELKAYAKIRRSS